MASKDGKLQGKKTPAVYESTCQSVRISNIISSTITPVSLRALFLCCIQLKNATQNLWPLTKILIKTPYSALFRKGKYIMKITHITNVDLPTWSEQHKISWSLLCAPTPTSQHEMCQSLNEIFIFNYVILYSHSRCIVKCNIRPQIATKHSLNVISRFAGYFYSCLMVWISTKQVSSCSHLCYNSYKQWFPHQPLLFISQS